MPDTFTIISGFLDRHAEDVEGRVLEELSPEIRQKLRALARGELPDAERESLAQLLQQNRHWVAALAQEVKALRGQANDESQSQP